MENLKFTYQRAIFLDRKAMAAALSIGERTLDRLRERGLPVINLPGCEKVLFHAETVEKWVLDHSEESGSDTAKNARARADAYFQN